MGLDELHVRDRILLISNVQIPTLEVYLPVQNSLLYFEALTQNKVPASLHVYPTGGHVFAFGNNSGTVEEWTYVLLSWLLKLN